MPIQLKREKNQKAKFLAKRIAIVSGLQVTDNPRVVKMANELSRIGYDLTVIGNIFDPKLDSIIRPMAAAGGWTHICLHNRTQESLRNRLGWNWARARRWIANKCHDITRIESASQLGYYVPETYSLALKLDADLYIAHNTLGLWVGSKLLGNGRKVLVDFEDWYSQDLLPADRIRMPIKLLQRCEKEMIKNAVTVTTSHAMSRGLSHEYDGPRPSVLYNVFPISERETIDGRRLDRKDKGRMSLCWYSQTIGPGRGLECLAQASHLLAGEKIEFHFRGRVRKNYKMDLLDRFALEFRAHVYFHEPVAHGELMSRIAEHDVGLAAEIPFCRNKDLTVSNKILQYLLAGLPVLASETQGQMEIATKCGVAIKTYKPDDPEGLATQMRHWANHPNDRQAAANAATNCGIEVFNWENCRTVLADCVSGALA